MGQATYMYAIDYEDSIPRDTFGSYQFFANKLAPYLAGPGIPYNMERDTDFIYNAYMKMPVYRCPSVRQASSATPYALMYTINSIDWKHFESTRNYRSVAVSRLGEAPGSPSSILYITEINPGVVGPKAFSTWDIHNLSFTTFNKQGVPNGSPRMIRASDQRHEGGTTIVFLDGHTERRRLHPLDLPTTLFNPLDK